ncbi:MAG: M20 family metallopeptidase [Eubacteriales bacterium]|nr:M20 family metallopeptidase [Eubacteriales bacterium]
MNLGKQLAANEIDEKKSLILELSDSIWDYAELSLEEYRSQAKYVEMLKAEGFDVTAGNNNIPTAFTASFGSGRPRIGILAEYDALSGLSQEAGKTENAERTPGAPGHGCGHNMLGAGAFAAALGIKKYLKENPGKGTVILFGCPGEEAAASKAFMARDNVWRELDAALTWHPEDCNEVVVGSSNACIQSLYQFKGTAAHASASPEQGRSALDAVELMNIGVQFLREHMSDRARVHYAITNTGGVSPNVVQARADVLYFVRSDRVSEAMELQKRVDKIAEGAALMTGTSFTKTFIDGLADIVPNNVLEELLFRNFEETGVPEYTVEELEFAEKIADTHGRRNVIPGLGTANDSAYALEAKRLKLKSGKAMNDFLLPYYKGDVFSPDSTDVGDVSWECPTAQIHVAAWPNGTPGHSWQNVSCGGSSIGHKAVITAGKVLAAAAVELFESPDIIKAAREEFELRTESGYCCPIPSDAVIRGLDA